MKLKLTLILLGLVSSQAFSQTFEGSSNAVKVTVEKNKTVTNEPGRLTLADLGITKIPKYHALIIGVSKYQNEGAGLASLEMPTRDAERLAQVLNEKYAFEKENIILLKKDPTREEIINGFDSLTNRSGERDNVLIFYADHGIYDKEKDFGYWLPSDAKKTTRAAWIANSTIKDYVGAIKAKHTLLITDACFGGSIFKTRSVEAIIRRFFDLYKDNSREALTSGNLSEVPDQSIFLKYLIKTLDENTDVFLASSTLFSRIYEPVVNNAPTSPQFGIIQGTGDEGGDFIFIKRD